MVSGQTGTGMETGVLFAGWSGDITESAGLGRRNRQDGEYGKSR